MLAPTLGILITYHNERELLRDCIDSFLAQSPPPDEILIHDDASEAPAEAYLPAGFHGTILHAPKNRGPARARNLLWHESHCTFIHFHDADDRVLPGWSTHVRAAIHDGNEAIFTEIQSRRGDTQVSPAVLGLARFRAGDDLVRFCLQGSMLVPAGTYRRSLVEAIHGYREDLWQSEDFDFHVRLALHLKEHAPIAAKFHFIPEPLVEINLRAQSRSRDLRSVWTDALKALERLSTELPASYRGDLSEAAVRMGSELFRMGSEEEARHAFSLAARWGTPEFIGRGPFYRWVAKRWGAECAEEWGRTYRRCLPEGVRAQARRWFDRKAA